MIGHVVEKGELKTITDHTEMKAALTSGRNIWIELEAQCVEADEILEQTLEIHPLTIEDIWQKRSQPKLEDYRNYLYLIIHALKGPKKTGLDLVEVDIVIGKTFLIT